MKQFTIQIAGHKVTVNPIHQDMALYCKDYLWEGEGDFSISISQADIAFEREKSMREDLLEGIPVRQFSDAYLETLAVQRKIAEELFQLDMNG